MGTRIGQPRKFFSKPAYDPETGECYPSQFRQKSGKMGLHALLRRHWKLLAFSTACLAVLTHGAAKSDADALTFILRSLAQHSSTSGTGNLEIEEGIRQLQRQRYYILETIPKTKSDVARANLENQLPGIDKQIRTLQAKLPACPAESDADVTDKISAADPTAPIKMVWETSDYANSVAKFVNDGATAQLIYHRKYACATIRTNWIDSDDTASATFTFTVLDDCPQVSIGVLFKEDRVNPSDTSKTFEGYDNWKSRPNAYNDGLFSLREGGAICYEEGGRIYQDGKELHKGRSIEDEERLKMTITIANRQVTFQLDRKRFDIQTHVVSLPKDYVGQIAFGATLSDTTRVTLGQKRDARTHDVLSRMGFVTGY